MFIFSSASHAYYPECWISVSKKVLNYMAFEDLKTSPGSHETATQREYKPLASIRNAVKFLLNRAF